MLEDASGVQLLKFPSSRLSRGVAAIGLAAATAYMGFTIASGFTSFSDDARWIAVFVKAVPCLTLSLLVMREHTEAPFRAKMVAAGLVFGSVGDFVLSYPGKDLFMAGLVSFALGHVLYIIAYSWRASARLGRALPWCAAARSPPTGVAGVHVLTRPTRSPLPSPRRVVAGSAAMSVLMPDLPSNLVVPVIVYVLLEVAVGWRAGALVADVAAMRPHGAWLAVSGAAMFVVSDGLLALNKFVGKQDRVGVLVMLTYWYAQALIALSLCTHVRQ